VQLHSRLGDPLAGLFLAAGAALHLVLTRHNSSTSRGSRFLLNKFVHSY
jgi:hypothetical protein